MARKNLLSEKGKRVIFGLGIAILSLFFTPQSVVCNIQSSLPWLHTDSRWFKNEKGDVLILRGANIMKMQEFSNSKEWLENEAENDAEFLASLGFNILRVPLSWADLEPEQGLYNDTKLEILDKAIEIFNRYGIYILIDMHQWNWSRHFSGDGMPKWVVKDFPAAPYNKNLLPQMQAEQSFWKDKDIQEQMAKLWRRIANRYSSVSGVIGYDLFNEPNPGSMENLFAFDRNVLYPFYVNIIKAIREVDKKHIIVVEPNIFRGMGAFRTGLSKFEDANLSYSPHLYTGGTADGIVGYTFSINSMEKEYKNIMADGKQTDAAVLIGEFGIGAKTYRVSEWLKDMAALQDKYLLGSIWWSYSRDSTLGLLNEDGTEKTIFSDILSRPFPRVIEGEPVSYAFDSQQGRFQMEFISSQKIAKVSIFLPKRHYINGYTLHCDEKILCREEWDDKSQILTVVTEAAENHINALRKIEIGGE